MLDVIAARGWVRDSDATAESASLECVCLFSLLGLVATAAVLLGGSTETIAAITDALMM